MVHQCLITLLFMVDVFLHKFHMIRLSNDTHGMVDSTINMERLLTNKLIQSNCEIWGKSIKFGLSSQHIDLKWELSWYIPFCATAFQHTFAWMLWRFTFRIAHAMVKHASSTFHTSHLFETIFENVRSVLTCSTLIEFFCKKFMAVPGATTKTCKCWNFKTDNINCVFDTIYLHRIRFFGVCVSFRDCANTSVGLRFLMLFGESSRVFRIMQPIGSSTTG